jgi:DNA-binding beta-propeller fold protein YncE
MSARNPKAEMVNSATKHVGSVLFAMFALAFLAAAPVASADSTICTAGSAAGECQFPNGVAVDYETGRLYVADTANNRVNVFDAEGKFVKTFGWGVTEGGSAKLEVCTVKCVAGIPGSGAGQFNKPISIAVDNDPASPSHHAIYVVDQGNLRVEKFDPEGNFLLTFGGGVDKTVPGNLCTAASGHACGSGANSTAEGAFFSSIIAPAVNVGVSPGGTVYVTDSLDPGGLEERAQYEQRLQKFEPDGTEIGPQHILRKGGLLGTGLGVDQAGNFWILSVDTIAGESSIQKFNSAGNQIGEIKAPGLLMVATDQAGNVFTVDNGEHEGFGPRPHINEYDPSGAQVRAFAYGSFAQPGGLAPYHSATGEIYASEREGLSRVQHLGFQPPGPLVLSEPCEANPLRNTKATLNANINSEGEAAHYHFELVSDDTFEHDVAVSGAGHGFDHATRVPEEEGDDPVLDPDFSAHQVSVEVPVTPETKYHCRVVATSAAAPGGHFGAEGVFTSLKALEIGSIWSSQVGGETATLNAEVNPLGIPTTGYFEYVDDATYQQDIAELGAGHGFDHAIEAPDVSGGGEPIDFGAGEDFKVGSASISGLVAGTTYHFRMIATDSLISPKDVAGPVATLLTYRAGERALPDQRHYELVSPPLKESAEVAVPGSAGGLFSENYLRTQAGAASGEAVTYTSWTSFGEPLGAPGASQYLSRRTSDGWQTENISPFGHNRNALPSSFRGFSADLGFTGVMVSEPPLTEDAAAGVDNLYLRDNQTGVLRALTVGSPSITTSGDLCLDYAGATADGRHVLFAANGAYAGAPTGAGFSLYEWSAEEGLQPVSLLPGQSSAAAPTPRTAFGAAGGHCGTGQTIVRNVISSDGSRVFWTYVPEPTQIERESGKTPPTQLLVRIDGEETVQVDSAQGTKAESGNGVFWGATPDGSAVFFTDTSKLVKGAKAEPGAPDLYRYEPGNAESLIDLSKAPLPAAVQGVVGISDDGAYVYFAASGAIVPGAEPGECDLPAPDRTCNLYLWHEGEGIRLVATLSSEDELDWDSAPLGQTARVSPDGHHLAFLSSEAERLVGYDNTIRTGIHCRDFRGELIGSPRCPEAFLYNADSGKLSCVSCNPSGARPEGPAVLPGWSNPLEGPHYLSDDGSRLFFESRDGLLPSDENKSRDTYEFERASAGGCTASSPAFNVIPGGCLYLISSGKNESDSYFIDASSSGRDVFFSTRQPLVGWDVNENYDVYDAREGGGFPEPPPTLRTCEGEACKAPPTAAPSTSSAASATFQGSGNASAKLKKKKRGHKAKKQKARRRHHEGRNAR